MSKHAPKLVEAALATAQTDTSKRTITGIATCFGTRASALGGNIEFESGSLSFPEDLRRVKLCINHDYERAIGYATSAEVTDTEITMSFYLPEGEAADEAMHSAEAGIRDGLSVGAYIEPDGSRYDFDTDTLRITRAVVREVSLTAVPAIDAARVTQIEHSLHTETKGMEHPVKDNTTTEKIEAAADTTPTPPPVAAPIVATRQAPRTVAEAAALVVKLAAEGAPGTRISSALQDITPANDPAGATLTRDYWIGQLWEARRTERPLIDSITHAPLPHASKIKGWRWKTRPTVDTYAGNKTDIPSSTVLTEEIETTPKRIAGGWDIDRIYVDLGDSQMIEALWAGALEDYMRKTETAVATELLAAATAIDGSPATTLDALTALGAQAGKIGARIDFVAFGANKWADLLKKNRDQMPWWIGGGDRMDITTSTGAINGIRFFMNPALGADVILAGDKRAATFYEATPPVRVNAIDLPRGGVDLGLFGYHGLLVHDKAALFKVAG